MAPVHALTFEAPCNLAQPSKRPSRLFRLPDNAPLEEIVYRLYVLNKIQQGMKNIDEGRGLSSEDLAREIEQW